MNIKYFYIFNDVVCSVTLPLEIVENGINRHIPEDCKIIGRCRGSETYDKTGKEYFIGEEKFKKVENV